MSKTNRWLVHQQETKSLEGGMQMNKTRQRTQTIAEARYPIISDDNPSWHYLEPITERVVTYTTGRYRKHSCMVLFAGADSIEPIIIPLEIIVQAADFITKGE